MRVLVVGAGLAGLYKADLLLKEGHEVVILEKTNDLGGQMRTIKYVSDNESYFFDVGPHLPPSDYKIWNDLCRRTESPLNMPLPIKVSLKLKPNLDIPFPLDLSIIRNITPKNFFHLLKYVPFFLTSSKFKIDEKNLEHSLINLWGIRFYQDYMYHFISNFWKYKTYKMSNDYRARVAPPEIKSIILTIKKDFISKIQNIFKFSSPKKLGTKNSLKKAGLKKAGFNNLYMYPKYGCQEIIDLLRDDVISKKGLIKTNCLITNLSSINNQIEVKYTNKENSFSEKYDKIIWAGSLINLIEILNFEEKYNLNYRKLLLINLRINKKDILGDKIHTTFILMRNVPFHRIYEPNKMSPYMTPKNKTSICLELTLDPKNDDFSQELVETSIKQFRSLYNLKESDIEHLGNFYFEEAYPLIFVDYKEELNKLKYEIKKKKLKISFIGRTGQYFPYSSHDTLQSTLG